MHPTTLHVDKGATSESHDSQIFAYSHLPLPSYESESDTSIGRLVDKGRTVLGQGIDMASRVATALFGGGGHRNADVSDAGVVDDSTSHLNVSPPLTPADSYESIEFFSLADRSLLYEEVEKSQLPLCENTANPQLVLAEAERSSQADAPSVALHSPIAPRLPFAPHSPVAPHARIPRTAHQSPPRSLPHYTLSLSRPPTAASRKMTVPRSSPPPPRFASPSPPPSPSPQSLSPSPQPTSPFLPPSFLPSSPAPSPPSQSPSPSLPPSPLPVPLILKPITLRANQPHSFQASYGEKGTQTEAEPSRPSAQDVPIATERKSLKMRGVDAYSYWFESRGTLPLEAPLQPAAHAEWGDLYLHWQGERLQVWLKDTRGPSWKLVSVGAFHPFLPNRRLCIRNDGKPSWIDNKSCTTYRTRPAKHAADIGNATAHDAKKRKTAEVQGGPAALR
ncbi:hypothetical protein BOTBODRAFT_57253 [Botryobasidium botryosum FD-172 SS1]|uniref:Uncharacterized protein n=1 Tax=Botryobasidium botryosum (strain FD-172 SS1) TaxID=930990 RepID=A0A067M7W7_BOTB1|nr:hypothetical protein BOTBODRAFT_57253 [Botryobasidium botryosum FD-172 SS1]